MHLAVVCMHMRHGAWFVYAYGIMSSVSVCVSQCQLVSQKLLGVVVLLPGCVSLTDPLCCCLHW